MEKKSFYIKESLKLFLQYGIKTVTIGQITQQLNVSSKTLYLLFGDKTGLVEACFELYRENTEKAYRELLEQAENVAEGLILFYHKLVESMSRINPNFHNDIARYFPRIWDGDEAFGKIQTRQLLERGIKENIFVSNIDPSICTETITLLIRSMFQQDPFAPSSPGMAKLMSNILWPYLRGISTPEGREAFRKYRRSFISI